MNSIKSNFDIQTLRALSQSSEFFKQGRQLSYIFEDMEEMWLSLYTKDKKCPIIEQIGTTVKRNLVRKYTAKLIKEIRNTIGFDLTTKVIDKDGSFWNVDDIVQRISDNKTETHIGLFKALVCSIFGIAVPVIDFMLKEEKTKGELYSLLKQFYYLKVIDLEEDDVITEVMVNKELHSYLNTKELTLFKIDY